MSESVLLPRNLLVFGRKKITQAQVQSDIRQIFIKLDLLLALAY